MPHLLCVDAIELPHAPGQIGVRGVDDEMIMIGHEAIGMTQLNRYLMCA